MSLQNMASMEVNQNPAFEGVEFTDNEIAQGMEIEADGFDITILTDIVSTMDTNVEDIELRMNNGEEDDALYFLPEVESEVEISSYIPTDDNVEERTFTDLDQVRAEQNDSDYESSDHASDMDLSHGSVDLSQTGPNAQGPTTSLNPGTSLSEIQRATSVISSSRNGYFPNGHVFSDKQFYPSPEIPIVRDTDGNVHEHSSGGCLDLSSTGPYSSNGTSYMHYSGGTSIELSRPPNGVPPGLLDRNGSYYQLPRIKLEPGLGIDPTIVYKPEMDVNHNHSEQYPSSNNMNIAYDPVYNNTNGSHFVNGCENESRDESHDDSRVKVEEVNVSRIPLTVTTADDDDENDSGTESIGSKDSDSSLRLSVGDDSGSPNNTTKNSNTINKDKSDRKRPGRKKGQVSKVYHLWEFIRDVLNDPNFCGKVIKWENEDEGIFRVVQSEVAATMWGAKKNNRTKMTYEKMSRSIRYSRKEGYFDDIPKDKGYPKKLCFKFGKKAHGWNMKRQISVEAR